MGTYAHERDTSACEQRGSLGDCALGETVHRKLKWEQDSTHRQHVHFGSPAGVGGGFRNLEKVGINTGLGTDMHGPGLLPAPHSSGAGCPPSLCQPVHPCTHHQAPTTGCCPRVCGVSPAPLEAGGGGRWCLSRTQRYHSFKSREVVSFSAHWAYLSRYS